MTQINGSSIIIMILLIIMITVTYSILTRRWVVSPSSSTPHVCLGTPTSMCSYVPLGIIYLTLNYINCYFFFVSATNVLATASLVLAFLSP